MLSLLGTLTQVLSDRSRDQILDGRLSTSCILNGESYHVCYRSKSCRAGIGQRGADLSERRGATVQCTTYDFTSNVTLHHRSSQLNPRIGESPRDFLSTPFLSFFRCSALFSEAVPALGASCDIRCCVRVTQNFYEHIP